MERKSGVLMHISSLFGAYSIGSFGREARYFIDFLAQCGFSWWQVLPFCMVDECNSPYKSYSTFAGNPYFIDLDCLYERGLLTAEELQGQRQQQPWSCEFVRLYHNRLPVLREASKRAENRDEIEAFIEESPYLKQFCEFMALKERNGQKPWMEWTDFEYDAETLFLWKFIQFEFFRQWREVKAYANSRGVQMIGDVPIYVSLDSADVWGNRAQFLLDAHNRPTAVAGVPPDYFSADGQLWGNPLYNWDVMRQDGYRWWTDRIRHMTELFDGVRIDHFRGLESFWSVPAGETTAKNGSWVKGPGMDLLERLRAAAGGKLLIAEDLGEITPEVEQLVRDSGCPGIRVLQFGFLGDDNNPHLPHNYTQNCVAYTGTHDNNTLLGYLWELDAAHKTRLLDYCNYHDADWERGYDSILRTLFASHAGLVILPIQDLLGYGSDTRLNIPGKADGNWQYRITKEQLDGIDRRKFLHFNQLYFRV